jgi:hypothetical protein
LRTASCARVAGGSATTHAKAEAEQEGKKAQRQASAEKASSAGKFAVPDGPKLVVNNKR